MLEWTSKNGNWQVKASKENWQVFFKNELVTEQGRLFATRTVPKNIQEKVKELVEHFWI